MPGLFISLGLSPCGPQAPECSRPPWLRLRGSAQQPQGLGAPRLVESARVGAEPTSPTPEPPGKPRSAGFSSCARSHVWHSAARRTAARQAPLSTGFPRQEYRSGLHFLLQGIFPTQGIQSTSLASRFFNTKPTKKPIFFIVLVLSELLIHLFAW